MTRQIDIPSNTYPAGSQQTSRLNLRQGERRLRVALTTAGWPAVSDGTLTLRFLVDRQGVGPVQEWQDTFQHVKLFKAGVEQAAINFEATLGVAFRAGDDFIVQKDADVAITTAITVLID